MSTFDAFCANDAELKSLRAGIRRFLIADREQFGWLPAVDGWLGAWDPRFSVRLAAAGFVGLTIPRNYGGHGLSHLHRYVVTEELLIAGAPVAAHWFADRQVAPALLAYGSEDQRSRLLPEIASGRCYLAIGMSEDIAGSDLAAAQCRATAVDGGWRINGTKSWTSGAHHAHELVVLARTSGPDAAERHAGFSQFLVPRETPGITVRPILQMSGEHHFNEVAFDDVHVPDTAVLGQVGRGWHQVTAELSFERSGPERFLSTSPLLLAIIRAISHHSADAGTAADVGHLLAKVISLRQLSFAVATTLTRGADATLRAALVKDLGTRFEQQSVELAADLAETVESLGEAGDDIARMLMVARLHAPMFTLRGGTNEVLRGVVARGMGLR
ncbi:acyl-CoA dehydrogenase [Mycobacterium sp. BK086]|uniref:acyl-CoA dehydrogenase family protein n=1 Tax=Mycobacterium sp. BK086 TaxID=2512165 RepID=UPI0010623AFE|nr:acyl-CoA dehydrogenase family protein [Mycobacterium sp. BK086]TDO09963.1 acyl-CoA dehydrogenase [Mycobacterium sp. BK086]